ncbi:transcriptional regulator [Myxococcota bacterium]|nr:transcriptional regulator [Myxococcota bacterium]MCZ7619485.1 transcriptional regulator [Myxococcota bacterium]
MTGNPDEHDDDPPGIGAVRTPRQQLRGLLGRETLSFRELREWLGLSVRRLEEELRHVERSARGRGERLWVDPPRCLACDFVFRDRQARHLHAPGRCPACRSERITEPRFRLEPR